MVGRVTSKGENILYCFNGQKFDMELRHYITTLIDLSTPNLISNEWNLFLESISTKPTTLSSVFYWGSGIGRPVKMGLPSTDTQLIQASSGRTQKAGVTKNGRLIVWEVSIITFNPRNTLKRDIIL